MIERIYGIVNGTPVTPFIKTFWLLNVFLGVPFTIPSYEYLAAQMWKVLPMDGAKIYLPYNFVY